MCCGVYCEVFFVSYTDILHVFVGLCIGLIIGLCGGVAFAVKGGLK